LLEDGAHAKLYPIYKYLPNTCYVLGASQKNEAQPSSDRSLWLEAGSRPF
jgi:hypothetical protein